MESQNISGEAIAEAVNLANELRAKFGEEKLDDLPAGYPHLRRHCILARAFNFDCAVNRSAESDLWHVLLRKESHTVQARALLEIMSPYTDQKELVLSFSNWKVYLPASLGEIAEYFDRNKLDDKYYEGKV